MRLEYEPLRGDARDDPYPVYRRLRDEAPLHYAPASRCYCVSRHEDVLRVLRTPEDFSSAAMQTVMQAGGQERPRFDAKLLRFIVQIAWKARLNPFKLRPRPGLISSDGDVHQALRRIVNRGFTPRRIAAWEPRIREITAERLAQIQAGERFDLIEDLAIPLPVTIIAEMLGVEAERQRDFKRWSDALIEGTSGSREEAVGGLPSAMIEPLVDMMAYLSRVIAARRRAPRDDLVSVLVADDALDGGAPLDDASAMQFVILLLIAGNETTTNLIGNTVNALLDHPDVLAEVAADPALVPVLVEEGLRYDAPVQTLFRNATRDVDLAGGRVPRGAVVAVLLGSANRDERRYPEPDRLDLHRRDTAHLGFGFGAHFCLGASLARLEARVALEALVPLLPGLEREPGRRELLDSFVVRGARHLPLRRAA
jgi:cytochrome P450